MREELLPPASNSAKTSKNQVGIKQDSLTPHFLSAPLTQNPDTESSIENHWLGPIIFSFFLLN